MRNGELNKLVSVAGRILLAYALILSQCALAGQNSKTKDKVSSPQQTSAQAAEKQSAPATGAKAQSQEVKGEASESAVAEEKSSRDGSHEGIKVHGHWTIEVRNPDGSLVRHVEFENSLDPANGNSLLTRLLARQVTVSHWQIVLQPYVGAGPCLDGGGTAAQCRIAEPEPNGACPSSNGGLTCPASNVFPTLNAPTLDANGNLVLSGQATAAMNSNVGMVSTLLHLCNPTIAPASAPCPATIGQDFKGLTSAIATTLPGFPESPSFTTPIPVSPGQLIAVTVVISFS